MNGLWKINRINREGIHGLYQQEQAALLLVLWKHQDEVKKLIAGPPQKHTSQPAYICNECVLLCNSVLDEEIEVELKEFLKPKESRKRSINM